MQVMRFPSGLKLGTDCNANDTKYPAIHDTTMNIRNPAAQTAYPYILYPRWLDQIRMTDRNTIDES